MTEQTSPPVIDAEALMRSSGLPRERAERALRRLRLAGLVRLLTSPPEQPAEVVPIRPRA